MIPRPTPSRLGWHLLLALVMLLIQQAGLRHAFEHDGHEDSAPTHAACVLCMAHHDTQGAAPVKAAPAMGTPHVAHVLHAVVMRPQCLQGVKLSYRSRAPPLFVPV